MTDKPIDKIKKKPRKSLGVQKEDKANTIYKMLLDQASRTEILEYSRNTWGLQRSSTDLLIAAATKMLKDDLNKTRSTSLAIYITSLRDLYKTALKQGNLQVARQTVMDQAKLLGLDQSTINHVIEDKRDLEDATDAELDSILGNN